MAVPTARALLELHARVRGLENMIRAERTVGRVQKKSFGAAGALRQLSGAFLGVGSGVYVGVRALQAFLSTSREVERSLALLRAASGGSIIGGETQYTKLVSLANKYGRSLDGLSLQYGKLLAAARASNIPLHEAQTLFEGVAAASSAMALSAFDTELSMQALVQIISKGTVQMEELRRQLAERFPGALGVVAKALNVTTEELNEMVKAGRLSAQEFVSAFGPALLGMYGELGEEAAMLLAATEQKFGTAITVFNTALADSTGVVGTYKDSLDGLTGLINTLSESMGSVNTPAMAWAASVDAINEKYAEFIRVGNAALAVMEQIERIRGAGVAGTVTGSGFRQGQFVSDTTRDALAEQLGLPPGLDDSDLQKLAEQSKAWGRVIELSRGNPEAALRVARDWEKVAQVWGSGGILSRGVFSFGPDASAAAQRDIQAIFPGVEDPAMLLQMARALRVMTRTYQDAIKSRREAAADFAGGAPEGTEIWIQGVLAGEQTLESRDAFRAVNDEIAELEERLRNYGALQSDGARIDAVRLENLRNQRKAMLGITQEAEKQERVMRIVAGLTAGQQATANLATGVMQEQVQLEELRQRLARLQDVGNLGASTEIAGLRERLMLEKDIVETLRQELGLMRAFGDLDQDEYIALLRAIGLNPDGGPAPGGGPTGTDYGEMFADNLRSSLSTALLSGNFDDVGAALVRALQVTFIDSFLEGFFESAIGGSLKSLGGSLAAGAASIFGGRRQAGGPVSGGTAYAVGELGTELFVPSTDGRILSHHESMGYNGGYTNNQQLVVVGDVDAATRTAVRQLGREISRESYAQQIERRFT